MDDVDEVVLDARAAPPGARRTAGARRGAHPRLGAVLAARLQSARHPAARRVRTGPVTAVTVRCRHSGRTHGAPMLPVWHRRWPTPHRDRRHRHRSPSKRSTNPWSRPRPGQFHMLYAFGVGEVPISVSARPSGEPVEHTVRAVGAVTGALAGAPVGAVVGVRGPYGTGWDLDAARGRRRDGGRRRTRPGPAAPGRADTCSRTATASARSVAAGRRPDPRETLLRRRAGRVAPPGRPRRGGHRRRLADRGWRGSVGVVTDAAAPNASRPGANHRVRCADPR